ncbi:ESX secretion-associated protein EspG [Allokutzneria sp. A3M-2-11 16]|uniref:ESX secretion-associated protein EspG n=1 Tax=Allokutzneria sp. A3M-2-11 16 TaxID=2962043 RepID=UPI0020B84E4F|nr:ESX secretion-associated protein EspG [Allokutzneria sp. A3M-2-11 16]MCP3797766.1 ESX secretion-associated protein EspG [Allokutzneria sp. A3M-2-11 16]
MTITISDTAYQMAWEHLGLEQMPLALLVNPSGAHHEERDAVVAAAWQELRSDGLVAGPDLDERLTRWLMMLAAPDRLVDARLWLGEEVRAVAAATRDEDEGVLAVLRGGRLIMRPIYATGLARAATELLPAVGPGPGHSVSVPNEVLARAARGAGSDPRALAAALRGEISGEDAEQLAQMIKAPGQRGQFGASTGRKRADHVVAYFDTAQGRYLMEDSRGWTTVSPADARVLVRQIDRLTSTAN